jgi:hypothetical protein
MNLAGRGHEAGWQIWCGKGHELSWQRPRSWLAEATRLVWQRL